MAKDGVSLELLPLLPFREAAWTYFGCPIRQEAAHPSRQTSNP